MTKLTSLSPKWTTRSDIYGAWASSLCLVHCLATPLIFVLQASTANACASSPWWWSGIDFLFLLISGIAIYYSAQHTSAIWMPVALYIGWTILTILIINEKLHVFPLPHILTYVPALSLVALHLYNRKYCRCAGEECCAQQLRSADAKD